MLQGMDVNLPETTTQPIRMPNAPLVLTVSKEGEYSLARKVVPLAELQAKLEAVFESRGSKEVFLRADEDAAYGVVVQGDGGRTAGRSHSTRHCDRGGAVNSSRPHRRLPRCGAAGRRRPSLFLGGGSG